MELIDTHFSLSWYAASLYLREFHRVNQESESAAIFIYTAATFIFMNTCHFSSHGRQIVFIEDYHQAF